nr:choline ABC transporter substrate-binding protein [Pseudovibrio flavus]
MSSASLGLIATHAHAEESKSCKTVRFADVGWTDITATTATATIILEALGYDTQVKLLSVPVTYASLKNKDIDIFLGNWMPTMESYIAPFEADGSVETLRTNLSGAKYTLAVPDYTYERGIKTFEDIAKFSDDLDQEIFGLEAGNDGNKQILDMINAGDFGLADFELRESSEAGMLSQVSRAIRRERDIVFLGWEPHPMNSNFKLRYLEGGDKYFGPNLGGAEVRTNVRAGYTQECPNIGNFLNNLEFTLQLENEIMGAILNDKQKPEDAAKAWLQKNPDILEEWLEGVTTSSGQNGLTAVKAALDLN